MKFYNTNYNNTIIVSVKDNTIFIKKNENKYVLNVDLTRLK
jgi:hypothetical protein